MFYMKKSSPSWSSSWFY